MRAHVYQLQTRRNPGGRCQQGQTYYRASCTRCPVAGAWRVDPGATLDDFERHASGRAWPQRRVR